MHPWLRRFLLCCAGTYFFWAAWGRFGEVEGLFMLVAGVGCAGILLRDLRLLTLGLADGGLGRRQLGDALLAVAAIVTDAANRDITEPEGRAIISLYRQALPKARKSDQDIITAFDIASVRPWTPSDAAAIDPQLRYVLLQSAITIAAAAPSFTETQQDAILEVGVLLGFEEETVMGLLRANRNYRSATAQASAGRRTSAMPAVGPVAAALARLGLDADATLPQASQQFRRLAMEHHPDRVPEHDKAAATSRFQDISEAYRFVKQHMR